MREEEKLGWTLKCGTEGKAGEKKSREVNWKEAERSKESQENGMLFKSREKNAQGKIVV